MILENIPAVHIFLQEKMDILLGKKEGRWLMSVQDDIKCAKYLIENGESEHDKTFHLNSAVYETTNEFLYAYRHLFVGQKSMLAPIGSCEQIFNAILEGIEEVDAFDISRFPKYFLYLGKAAIESLTIEEYIEFFHGPNFDDISY